MNRARTRILLVLSVLLGSTILVRAAEQPAVPDLSEFRTVETAITTRISQAGPALVGQAGYLGIAAKANGQGKLTIEDVETDSPAAKAGLQRGDILTQFGNQSVDSAASLRDLLQSSSAGSTVSITVERQSKPLTVTATLTSTSRPMKVSERRVLLGLQVGEPKETEGLPIEQVTSGSPAAIARLKTGDTLLKIDGTPITSPAMLRDLLGEKNPEDKVTLSVLWDGKPVEVRVQLAADNSGSFRGRNGGGWDDRALNYWKKDVYRLAMIGIEYPDTKHSDKVSTQNWEEALFSKSLYNKKSITGQTVFGSLNDYYLEQSFGKLRVEGKVFEWVPVSKKRADYSQGTGTGNKTALLVEAMDKLLARDGKDALQGFDGVFFMYAGDRFPTTRGGLYWPHRANFMHQGKRWSYFICAEGGSRMSTISVFCHEFGHMLGLPDLYARPENPGSEGVGVWCAMSNQVNDGRPQHFCAWSKEKLDWVKPAVIDPTVKQKLILSPIEDSPKECFKVLVKSDGSEYFLLENRRKKGFDQSLPAEGLLIWRVVNNKPILEESHGVEGPEGPRRFLTSVPFPSTANNSFTPYTTPSSRSQLGGGLPVYVTNIRKLPDGRITFYIGHEFQ